MTKVEVRVICLAALKWRGPQVRNAVSLRKLARKEIGSSLDPPEGRQLCWHAILAQWDPFQASDIQNGEMIHLCCFKATKVVAICYSGYRKPTCGSCGVIFMYIPEEGSITSPQPKPQNTCICTPLPIIMDEYLAPIKSQFIPQKTIWKKPVCQVKLC